MIVQDKVLIKITNRNRKYYKNLGYDVSDKFINIDVSNLSLGSNIKVDVSCDICNKKLNVAFYNYNKYRLNFNIYTCKYCSINYKTKLTNIEKYGVDIPTKNESVKDKIKKTNLEKYGSSCALLSPDIKKKTKKKSLKLYGVEIPCTSLSSKRKRKLTNLEKYGFENIFQSIEFKEKMKIYKSKNNLTISSELENEWNIYKNDVRRFTKMFKEELYSNWNGFDFYDNEFIQKYLILHHNDKKYPTIDHKISIFDGFNNGIPADVIGDISNLSITKRTINSSKNLKSFY